MSWGQGPATDWYDNGFRLSRGTRLMAEIHPDECILAFPFVHPELGPTCIRGDHPTPSADCWPKEMP